MTERVENSFYPDWCFGVMLAISGLGLMASGIEHNHAGTAVTGMVLLSLSFNWLA